ncbi:MAG TPA: polyphosphate kinase 1 [Prolixibacteraceae bacterium]|nr:polyphosphate kinase 1 [Prolixibacteraceae bacterium]
MATNYKYFNRDISWLYFNHRVLEEAKDHSLPLYERIRFLAIYSNNLEEFYQVRVSYYRQLLKNAELFHSKIEEVQPAKILHEINEMVTAFQLEFHQLFDHEIIPELRKHRIILLDKNASLSLEHEKEVKEIFTSEILSVLQPVLLLKKRIRPFLKTGQTYLVLQMVVTESGETPEIKARKRFGLIKVPTDHDIARFIELQPSDENYYIIFLEDVIMRHVQKIFPGYSVINWYSIKLTRDADMDYDDYEEEDLIDAIENISSSRTLGKPNRFLFDRNMPVKVLRYLMQTFKIGPDILVQGGAYHNFRDFFNFPNPLSPNLEYKLMIPVRIPELDESATMSEAINRKDYLLSVPYQSFDYFIRFLQQAAQDPTVTEIKATQYRVAERSAVVNALMNAAENGKKVTVFVELKARFDEEANLQYAAEMTKAGIRIIYSIPRLKVHAKLAMIIRQKNNEKQIQDQAYLATGNFNEKTARIYCDQGLFTAHEGIIADLKKMFRYLEEQETEIRFKHLLVPNFNLIHRFGQLINQEIENAKKGKKGYILLKMNGLQDPHMVNMLYIASEAGVQIDLIIRGICILKPGKKYSRNIRIIRIIDRFLEHSRVYVFHNDNKPVVYLGSADWMKRNLYTRVECVFPIYDPMIRQEILDILHIQLQDNVKACELGPMGENIRVKNEQPPIRSQMDTHEYFRKKYNDPDHPTSSEEKDQKKR